MNRIGPAALQLEVPRELADADPALLRRTAARHRSDASALTEQARGLRAAVVGLVPAAWSGLGSLGFAGAALLQAGSLEAIAAASADVATALVALADRLAAARDEALAAVRAGRRLDDEVAADNAVWNRRPEPERADPDPARLAAQDAEARMLTVRLLAATEAAQSAWAQACAAFDLVAYRMPGLATSMSTDADDTWRPSVNLTALPAADRRRMLGLVPGCVGVGWAGSGALVGPDGRRYPLVVPWVEQGGQRWTADQDGGAAVGGGSVGTLDGADPGWHEIGVRVGVDTFGPAASTATKAAIVTAGFVGNAPRMIGRLRPDLLPRLRWTTGGVPVLAPVAAVPAPRPGGTTSAPVPALVRDGERLRWVSDTTADGGIATRPTSRLNPDVASRAVTPAAPNVLALTNSGLTAVDTASRLDDSRIAAYRATFEENVDGRIRARLTLYQVRGDGSDTNVLSRDAGIAPDGALTTQPVRYRPQPGPVIEAAPSG